MSALQKDINKRLRLIEEAENVKFMVLEGLTQYATCNGSEANCDSVLSSLSLGIEKLCKLIIVVDEYTRFGEVETNIKRKYSHNLLKLRDRIASLYDRECCRSVYMDQDFVLSDENLNEILDILKEYLFVGKFDAINTVAQCDVETVKDRWFALEERLVPSGASLYSIRNRKQKAILYIVEKYVRALVRLPFFDCMNADAKSILSPLMVFLKVSDNQLGERDYQTILDREKGGNVKRIVNCSEEEFIRKYGMTYSRKKICKEDFNGKWPFIFDSAIIECRDGNNVFVILDGHYYSLTGATGTRYKLSGPHSAGVAKIGMSIQPVIDMAFELTPVADFLKN